MFISIIDEILKNFPDDISIFKYYIERHIEVHGEHHSHLASQITANLCDIDEQFWNEAEEEVIQSLKRRLGSWDGVYEHLNAKTKTAVSVY
jgi:DNA-binding transcriptional regulator GbsR (MarR family)